MERKEFEGLVIDILEKVPGGFKDRLENIDIVIDEHTIQHTEDSGENISNRVILALYQGVPITKRGGRKPLFPDKITIFKKAMESIYPNRVDLEKNLKRVVLHELGHYFGLDEEKLNHLGY
jgi:predicted Zn-dependent protease with MMP-like domain